jgi:hypothetical protein
MQLNGHSHLADPNEDLSEGTWTRERLVEMDLKFTAALEAAFAAGLESRESARREVKLPATLGPHFIAPPIPDGLLRSPASDATCFVARG